jgi:hypothetical protein
VLLPRSHMLLPVYASVTAEQQKNARPLFLKCQRTHPPIRPHKMQWHARTHAGAVGRVTENQFLRYAVLLLFFRSSSSASAGDAGGGPSTCARARDGGGGGAVDWDQIQDEDVADAVAKAQATARNKCHGRLQPTTSTDAADDAKAATI